ncbi:MAG: hypothetical protein OXT65_12500 [Alphaproteobacteria bacterium]|nr:hypothetical protein [Alphaproteobacteria bacterium]
MKHTERDLLKTKIKDLTAEDKSKLETPLGTLTRPFPMWGTQRIRHKNGRTDLDQVLTTIAAQSDGVTGESEPMMVYSTRPYKEVMALAYCDMPVPSMLPLFFDGLERRKPESTNRTQFMIGDPGHGKSFLGALQSRLRSKERAEVLDCGGKNMRELLFEMVLDFGTGDALPTAIDKRLQAGALQPISVGLLKELDKPLSDSGEGSKDKRIVEVAENGDVLSIDWAQLKTVGHARVDHAFSILSQVSKIEGLDNQGGNALGMNSQFGPLVQKFINGEEMVLDEYNKSREGTDDNLQTVWQFMIGEIDTCTVENPLKNKDAASGPSEFTFKREDMKAGFFITLTGNKKEDGLTTRSLNKSVYSRLSPQTLPDPDVMDWQHRICQMMTGMPVSTLYHVFRDDADKKPEDFGKWLLWLRETKAESEGTVVPDLQKNLLNNWKDVVSASEKLAKFYDKWALMTDSEKLMESGNTALVEEVDDEYTKKEGIDFRKIKQHLEEAIPIRPRMQPFDAPVKLDMRPWDEKPDLGTRMPENPSAHFGTRLVEYLDRIVYEKSAAVGKTKLYDKLQGAMQEFGLRDIHLQEGEHSHQRSVEQLLNLSDFDSPSLSRRAEAARKVFCEFVRQADPDIEASDDHIISAARMREVLEDVARRNAEGQPELMVVNRAHESLSRDPVQPAEIRDEAANYSMAEEDVPSLSLRDIVHHDDFLAALAMPTVSSNNLDSIWGDDLRQFLSSGQTDVDVNDEPLKMAENRSETKLGITSLQVLFNGKAGPEPVSLHVVRDSARNKTLIVSEEVPSSLLPAFREAGITHVNRNAADARHKTELALRDMVTQAPGASMDKLAAAFGYRYDIGDATKEDIGAQLPDFLVSKNMESVASKYVVRKPGGPQV